MYLCYIHNRPHRFVRALLAIFCCFITSISSYADDGTLTIKVTVYDNVTKKPIPGSMVTLTAISDTTAKSFKHASFDGVFQFPIPHKPLKYLVSVSAEKGKRFGVTNPFDYEPTTFELDLTNLKPDDYERKLPDIYLLRYVERKLDEVTVTASKVKFYYKGDTLVYNADAFITPEGSMLNALLSQIPDIELKRNGVILHKGKKIESLLLNGKDLFNKDRQLMLENIGAYTVRDINLYTETGRDNKLLGFNAGDNKYVMNVRLKREYSQGFMMNADLGYGSKERYVARLFGMWFSDIASIAVNGSTNNLNYDLSNFDSELNSPPSTGNGINTMQSGGLNYTVEGDGSEWKITGMAKYTGNRPIHQVNSYIRNYLPTGDTHQYSWNESHNKSHEVSSNHKAEFSIRSKVNITVEPTFNYTKNDDRSSSMNATLSEELGDSALSIIGQLYAGGQEGLASLLNRQRLLRMGNGENINGTLNARGVIKTSRRSWLTISSYANMANRSYNTWQAYNIAYGNVNGSRTTMQHFGATPDRDRQFKESANWKHRIGKHGSTMGVQYTFTNFNEKRTRIVHGGTFDGNLITDSVTYDILPSMTHNLPEISAQSYRSEYDERRHLIWLETTLRKETPKHRQYIIVELPLRIADRRFTYERGGRTQRIDRTQFMPGGKIRAGYNFKAVKGMKYVSLSLGSTPHYASLFNVVDITDDTDPLNVYVGNPNLKNYRINNVAFNWQNSKTSELSHDLKIDYSQIHNANARGYYYNTVTGVKTYRTYNVNGNFNARATYKLSKEYSKRGHKILSYIRPSIYTDIRFERSVDLAGSTTTANPDFSMAPPKRKVNTFNVNETARLYVDFKRMATITGTASVSYQRYTSPDEGFTDFSSWVNNYSIQATVNLPRNWGLSTDLTLYTRRGFTDRQLNTTDLVWNARATKSILKGSVVFVVDAYDLLRQLTNVTYTINAQARTETVSNVIPAYVLFHIQYRWNKQPKR